MGAEKPTQAVGSPVIPYALNTAHTAFPVFCVDDVACAVEIVLKESELRDASGVRPDETLWEAAVRGCGYIQSRIAVGETAAVAFA